MLEQAIERITEQQQGKENTPAWMVGEQLKDMLRMHQQAAEKLRGALRALAQKYSG